MSLKASKFKHGIATYPRKWKGYHVSPEKICIQFADVTAKTRIANHDPSDLGFSYEQQHYMPIQHTGTDIEFIAIGVPLDMHHTMLLSLIEAYREHMSHYPTSSLRSKLVEVHRSLGDLLGLTS